MTAPEEDDQEKPLDPAVERVRRRLVRFIAINLGILFLALMAVVIALVYRATRVPTTPAAPVSELPLPADGAFVTGEIALPEGVRVAGHSLSGNVLSLSVELADGRQAIFLYDVGARRLIGRLDITGAR